MKRICLALAFILLLCATAHAESFTDSSGREINFSAPFTRIISLYPAHTENLFRLGLDAQIIGVSRDEDFPLEATEKPTFSPHDGVEKFLAAKPDLVLVRPMLMHGYANLWAALERHGITVVSLQPRSIRELFSYWHVLGSLTGHAAQAKTMIREFKEGVAKAEERLKALPADQHPGVFFESIHRKYATFAKGSMPLFVLKEAGGVNVAADAESRHGTNIAYYGLERLLNKGDKIDIYLAQYGRMNKVSVKEIRNMPAASRVKAVLNNDIFLVDEHLVSRPTMRLLNGIEVVYQLLHP